MSKDKIKRILELWSSIEESESNMSTEALIEMVKQAGGFSHDEVIDAICEVEQFEL
jgi:hypothetical protein